MGLFDRIGARPEAAAPAAKREAYDFVEIPLPDGEVRRMSKGQFEAQPLTDRVRVLVQGTARFFRGDQVVPTAEALKTDY